MADKFKKFCSALRMPEAIVSKVAARKKQIIKRINDDFWGISSEDKHGLYVGSYGRGTDIHVSDIDLMVELPPALFQRFKGHQYNGPSALLQTVKSSLRKTYSESEMRGDGQIIQLNFHDGICFEILPAFLNSDD